MSDRKTHQKGMGGHQNQKRKGRHDEWYTQPYIIDSVGGWISFDLDPCAPLVQPHPTARHVFTKVDNGLIQDWGDARVWLNPPYSRPALDQFLAKMAAHDHGTALIFARTDTDSFHRYVAHSASAVLFLRKRLKFMLPDGTISRDNGGAPSVLCAYGQDDMDILAECKLDGLFVPLRISKSVLVEALTGSWRQELKKFMAGQDGPVGLDTLYRAFADHVKAKDNPNYRAKLRQTLQRGGFTRVARGLWDVAPEPQPEEPAPSLQP